MIAILSSIGEKISSRNWFNMLRVRTLNVEINVKIVLVVGDDCRWFVKHCARYEAAVVEHVPCWPINDRGGMSDLWYDVFNVRYGGNGAPGLKPSRVFLRRQHLLQVAKLLFV